MRQLAAAADSTPVRRARESKREERARMEAEVELNRAQRTKQAELDRAATRVQAATRGQQHRKRAAWFAAL